MKDLHLLLLENFPIHEQLKIEEALLRLCRKNYCLINQGSPPSIVMGISSITEKVVHPSIILEKKVPLIKRFSGGGCVVVDSDTLFVSFILQKEALGLEMFPEPILRWSANFYQKALEIPGFCLKENDYAIANHKCGGNAQYLRKNRFVHHTTFLWDYSEEKMNFLLFPPKVPKYREERSHENFLTQLKHFLPSKEEFTKRVSISLEQNFSVKKITLENVEAFLEEEHRKSVTLV